MKRILLLAVTISLFGYITAQNNNTWKVYLQGHAVKSIAFENQYVWVATDSFLVQLNKTFDKGTTYYSYPFINENGDSYKLKIDKNGVKWLARSAYVPWGSSYYERYTSSIYSFPGNQWKEVKSLGYGLVYSMALDKNDNKWIATMGNNGLYKIEKDICSQYTPENSGLIYEALADVGSDKDGNIWMANFEFLPLIGANIALIRYDGDEWITHYTGSGTSLMTMKIDNQGNPWLQSLKILQKFDPVSNSWTESMVLDTLPWSSLSPFAYLLTIEGMNKLWFRMVEDNGVGSVKDSGMAVYDGSDWSHYSTSNSELPSDTVYQIAVDDDGTKWIGTANGLVAFNENGLLSTDSYSEMMDDIILFPNPAKDFITLKLPDGLQNSNVDILNIQGRSIKMFSINNNRNLVDVSQFPSGIYLVRIQSDENYTVKKFVKQ